MELPVLFFFILLWACGSVYYCSRNRVLEGLPNISLNSSLGVFHVIGVFLAFLFFQAASVPLLILYRGGTSPILLENPYAEGWFNVANIGATLFMLLGFTALQRQDVQRVIWSRGKKRTLFAHFRAFLLGVGSWLVCYPIVYVFGHILRLAISLIPGYSPVEQSAVEALRRTFSYPLLNILMIAGMAGAVPVIEELLFRGYFQTWLRRRFGGAASIAGASLLFAAFHFSLSQSLSNLEYLPSLFLLSYALGYLYETQRSLWAPIGLHMAFNSVSILFLEIYYQL